MGATSSTAIQYGQDIEPDISSLVSDGLSFLFVGAFLLWNYNSPTVGPLSRPLQSVMPGERSKFDL